MFFVAASQPLYVNFLNDSKKIVSEYERLIFEGYRGVEVVDWNMKTVPIDHFRSLTTEPEPETEPMPLRKAV